MFVRNSWAFVRICAQAISAGVMQFSGTQEVAIHGFRHVRILRSNILTRPERQCEAFDVRWARLCSFVLLCSFQRLGHRCWCRQRITSRSATFAWRVLKNWHYLLRDTDLICRNASGVYEVPWTTIWVRHICERGYHIWSPIVLRNYLSFSACSKSCLRLIVRYARSILFGYNGTRFTQTTVVRFILITSARYKCFVQCPWGTSMNNQQVDV